jgi:hypothetical protein
VGFFFLESQLKEHNFTKEQMKDFAIFERIRAAGKHNMADKRARIATNLSERDYMFIVGNYPKMRKQYLDQLEVERRNQLPLFPELS